MRYSHKQIITLFVLIVFSLMGAGLYYIKLVSTDIRIVENSSIEYYLLVPDILKEIPLEQTDQLMGYHYTSADANNPAIISVEFITQHFAGATTEKLVSYFDGLGFEINNNVYRKNNIEISITHSPSELGAVLMNVSLVEY
jgi:hypothetical protein